INATGSRTYTNLTSGAVTVQQILQLHQPGGVGGNTNLFYPISTPILDGDGLTFDFASPPPIAQRWNDPLATNQMNLWFEGSVQQYDEENRGGTHEESPLSSSMTVAP